LVLGPLADTAEQAVGCGRTTVRRAARPPRG